MGWLLPALTDERFATQRDVVLNERRQSYDNRPYGLAQFALLDAIFPAAHPYHWPTIGAPDDLRAATADDARAFFSRYYHPGNASLCIGGDIEAGAALDLAARYFGEIPAGPPVSPVEVTAPVARPRRLVLEDRVELPRLYLAWPSPALFARTTRSWISSRICWPTAARPVNERLTHEARIATELRPAGSRELGGTSRSSRARRPATRSRSSRRRSPASCPSSRPRPDGVRARARPRAGRGLVRLSPADARRFWRTDGSAQRLQRPSREARLVRRRPAAISGTGSGGFARPRGRARSGEGRGARVVPRGHSTWRCRIHRCT